MALFKPVPLYIAVRKEEDRQHLEDALVLDGFNPGTFPSASSLWARFKERPARMVITDRRFGDEFSGLDLVRAIRRDFELPYVYTVVLSKLSRLKEIEEGLVAGVDDYLVKPHNPLQLRSRILVGLRWLTYIDSITRSPNARTDEARAGSSGTGEDAIRSQAPSRNDRGSAKTRQDLGK